MRWQIAIATVAASMVAAAYRHIDGIPGYRAQLKVKRRRRRIVLEPFKATNCLASYAPLTDTFATYSALTRCLQGWSVQLDKSAGQVRA